VILTNSFCLAKKIRKLWLPDCKNPQINEKCNILVSSILKISKNTLEKVLKKGIIGRVS
jgi:hypothetical protein